MKPTVWTLVALIIAIGPVSCRKATKYIESPKGTFALASTFSNPTGEVQIYINPEARGNLVVGPKDVSTLPNPISLEPGVYYIGLMDKTLERSNIYCAVRADKFTIVAGVNKLTFKVCTKGGKETFINTL